MRYATPSPKGSYLVRKEEESGISPPLMCNLHSRESEERERREKERSRERRRERATERAEEMYSESSPHVNSRNQARDENQLHKMEHEELSTLQKTRRGRAVSSNC